MPCDKTLREQYHDYLSACQDAAWNELQDAKENLEEANAILADEAARFSVVETCIAVEKDRGYEARDISADLTFSGTVFTDFLANWVVVPQDWPKIIRALQQYNECVRLDLADGRQMELSLGIAIETTRRPYDYEMPMCGFGSTELRAWCVLSEGREWAAKSTQEAE